MTYFAFLAIFLGIPIALLSVLTIFDYQRGKWLPTALNARRAWVVLLALCGVAFIYTTPWDNYLVATKVWWYHPDKVAGIVFGWVPIEEYTFFLVLPVMTGLFLLLLIRYMPPNQTEINDSTIRIYAATGAFILWVISVSVLVLTFLLPETFRSATYLSITLSWALIPIMIQLAFGADILWRHRFILLPAIAIPTLYLSATDKLAIYGGTWTINPEQSLPILIGGILPIEEFVFFLIVNVLVVMGMILVLAEESQVRARALERYSILRPFLRLVNPPLTLPMSEIARDIR